MLQRDMRKIFGPSKVFNQSGRKKDKTVKSKKWHHFNIETGGYLPCMPQHASCKGKGPPQLFTCMSVNMVPKERNCTESFQTKVTHVGLFSAVNFHMTIETRNSRRGELAQVAVEGSFYFCRRERQHLCVCKHFSLGVQIPLIYIKVTWHILFLF